MEDSIPRRPRPIRLALAAAFLAAPGGGWAQSESPLAPEPQGLYAGAGPFVVWPARILSKPVIDAGFMAGALACFPISLWQDPRMEGKVPRDRSASIVCGRSLGLALGWPVYAAAGLPFLILKGLFWDAPQAAASALRGPAPQSSSDKKSSSVTPRTGPV